ncbi:MAG: DegT/DnrJ/EryC1/StrS family aminotransferase, partial [Patescibacteria group bacterium]
MKKPLPTYNSITKQDLANAFKAISQKPLSGFVGRAGQHFLGGELVRELENRFCRYFKVKYAVSFNSATAALQAAVGALGIGPGDEVITSPTTMCATPSSVLANSALPVFVDIESDTFNINPELVEGLI